jgi:hypothetical protein
MRLSVVTKLRQCAYQSRPELGKMYLPRNHINVMLSRDLFKDIHSIGAEISMGEWVPRLQTLLKFHMRPPYPVRLHLVLAEERGNVGINEVKKANCEIIPFSIVIGVEDRAMAPGDLAES